MLSLKMGVRSLLTRREKGKKIEEACHAFLKRHSIQIILNNFCSKFGEVDIIGKEKDTLIFFEVRYRQHEYYGSALESVTVSKQQRIYKTALFFLMKHRQFQGYHYRFDIIGASTYNGSLVLDWQKNAFQPIDR